MSSSSQDPTSSGRPGALLFSSKDRLNPETFSVREDFPKYINRFWERMNSSLDSLIRKLL